MIVRIPSAAPSRRSRSVRIATAETLIAPVGRVGESRKTGNAMQLTPVSLSSASTA